MSESKQRISANLPGVIARLMPALFSRFVPRETDAACASCSMWPPRSGERSDGLFFSPEIKCCTYLPNLPNFLVGGLLEDDSQSAAQGRQRLEAQIENRSGVTPWGICRSERYDLLYNGAARHVFGRSKVLRCPYYEETTGSCTIRPWWISICHTWFCKHVTGKDGLVFWTAVRRHISQAETVLAQYCAWKLGAPIAPQSADSGSSTIRSDQLDEVAPPIETHLASWGKWTGQERAFYRRSYQVVENLTRLDLERLMGFTGMQLLDDVKRCLARLRMRHPPALLKRATYIGVTKLGDDSYRLTGYSPYDPMIVTKAIYDLLDEFDGRRTNQSICAARRQRKASVPSPQLLLNLYRMRLLIEPGRESE